MKTRLKVRLLAVSLALAAALATPESSGLLAQEPTQSPGGEGSRPSQIDAVLDSKIDLKVDKLPVRDALAAIRVKARFNLIIDEAEFERAAIDARELAVTVDVTNVSVRSILNLILHGHELAWLVRAENIIFVTSAAHAETIMEVQVYPVGDLVIRPDGGWPRNRFVPKAAMDGGLGPGSEVDDLIETITGTVAPTTWNHVGGVGSIKFLPTALALTIVQKQAVLTDIESLLEKLRKARKSQLDVGSRDEHGELILVSYTMPRYVPSWRVSWPAPPSQYAYPQHYEIDLKASLSNAAATAKEFAVVIPQVIEPGSWKAAGGKGEIFVVNDRLVVRQTAGVQSQIASLLGDQSSAFPASIYKGAVVPGLSVAVPGNTGP